MSFTAKCAFEARITNNDRDNLANIAGKYYNSDVAADCDAGFLCKRDSLLDCEGFTGVKNENAWKMVKAVAADDMDTVIYACNTYDVKMLADGSKQYAIGRELLGLGVPSGRYGNFTHIKFDGESVYRFGEGNVTINTTGDTYFTIANGFLSSATAKPTTAGTVYFELRKSGKFIEGNSESFAYYDLVACKVSA